MKARQLIRPDDQLPLTEAELNEEVPKILTTSYSNVVKNLVVYSFKDSCFINVPPPDTTITLFEVEGTALHVESDEAKAQMANCREEGEKTIILFFNNNIYIHWILTTKNSIFWPKFFPSCEYPLMCILN